MKENFKKMINKAVLAGAVTLGISGQTEAREPARNTTALAGEAQAGQSQPTQDAFEKSRVDYLAGKWVDASVISSTPLEEDVETEYISQKYLLRVMKPQFRLGKGVLVAADSTDGFVTVDKNSGKVVYLNMLEVGNPEKPTNDPAFQALVAEILNKEGLPASVVELFRGLLVAQNK